MPRAHPQPSSNQLQPARNSGVGGSRFSKNISNRSFDEPDEYRLKRGWSLVACDGRSEGDLGRPGYVTVARCGMDGWMDGVEPPHASSTEERHPSRLPARRAPRPRSPGATEVCRDWIGCRRARRGDLRTGANLIPRVGEAESELGKRADAAYEKWTRAYCLQSDGADEFEAALRAQGPGKVAKCPSWSPGALSRRHLRAACYLRPGPARPWYELDNLGFAGVLRRFACESCATLHSVTAPTG